MRKLMTVLLGLGAFAAANATPIVISDVWNPAAGVNVSNTYTYIHNINDNGFNGATDLITSADIDIRLKDDEQDFPGIFNTETVRLKLDNVAQGSAFEVSTATMALMGPGLGGVAFAARRKKA